MCLVDALRQVGLVLNAGTTKIFDDAEPTPSRTCITWRDSCGKFGTRPCAQVVGLYDKHSHGWQPRTWFGTPPPSCIQGFLRKQIKFYLTRVCPLHNDYTSCLFCKWPSQNLQIGPSQVGRQIPQTRARHCGPSWRLRLVCSVAPHPSRVERTRFGMCWRSWCQIMVPEMPGITLEISKLHCQPFR